MPPIRYLTAILSLFVLILAGCATTPQGKLHKGAALQKISVDGLGNTYLDICEQVVKPMCVDKNDAAAKAGTPWAKEERIACLGPCSSANAEKAKPVLDAVIAAQLVVYGLLKSGTADQAKLDDARSAYREAGERLLNVLREIGALDMIQSKMFGGK